MSGQEIMVVAAATVAQFITGAIWYTALFGELWGKMHGFDKLSKKEQEAMMSQMGPILGLQAFITAATSIALVMFAGMFPNTSLYTLVAWIIFGFVMPAHVSGILFGGTPYKWMLPKTLVMTGGSIASLMIGALVVSMML